MKIKKDKVGFGIVTGFFNTGRKKNTGYGFVRSSGPNVRKAFFHIDARMGLAVDAEGEMETTSVHDFSREPKVGHELTILWLERDPKGLRVSGWCFAEEYRKVLAECDERNAECVRRVGAKERLEADIAQAGWPALSLVPTPEHEGEEYLSGRYSNRLVAKKDGLSNTVGAVLLQTITRDGAKVERRTELPDGTRFIERAYYMTQPKPEHLYINRAEAVEEMETLLGLPLEQWGVAVEFTERIQHALGSSKTAVKK